MSLFHKINNLGRNVITALELEDLPAQLKYWIQSKIATNPHDTIPLHIWSVDGADANIDACIEPKGNGAFQLDKLGAKRGNYAIDLQRVRANESEVSSGEFAFIEFGKNNTSNEYLTKASGDGSVADIYALQAWSTGLFINGRFNQKIEFFLKGISQKDNEILLTLDGSLFYFPLKENHIYSLNINLLANRNNTLTNDDSASWYINLLVQKVGNVLLFPTITSQAPNNYIYNGFNFMITIDSDGDFLQLKVTGDTANDNLIYWSALIQGVEICNII